MTQDYRQGSCKVLLDEYIREVFPPFTCGDAFRGSLQKSLQKVCKSPFPENKNFMPMKMFVIISRTRSQACCNALAGIITTKT